MIFKNHTYLRASCSEVPSYVKERLQSMAKKRKRETVTVLHSESGHLLPDDSASRPSTQPISSTMQSKDGKLLTM